MPQEWFRYLPATVGDALLQPATHEHTYDSVYLTSQITHLDMHHLVFGINFQIHSVSLILVLIHLLFHFSTHLSHHPRSRHPSLLHSVTPGSKPTFSTNPSHRRFLLPTGLLTIMGLDRTYHAHHFIFSFTYLIFCLFRVVDYKLATSQLFTAS